MMTTDHPSPMGHSAVHSDREALDYFAEIILGNRFANEEASAGGPVSKVTQTHTEMRSVSDNFSMDAALASLSSFWGNGEHVHIDFTVAASNELSSRSKDESQQETLLESWRIGLNPLFSIVAKASPPHLLVSKTPGTAESNNLLALALRSYLHFSPVNSWLLRDPTARSRLRYRCWSSSDLPTASLLSKLSYKKFAPLQLQQSELTLEVHFQPICPGMPWFNISQSSEKKEVGTSVSSTDGWQMKSPEVLSPRRPATPEKRARPKYFADIPARDPPPLRKSENDDDDESSDCQHIKVHTEGRRVVASGFFGEPKLSRNAESPDPRRKQTVSPPATFLHSKSVSPGRSVPIPISPVRRSALGRDACESSPTRQISAPRTQFSPQSLPFARGRIVSSVHQKLSAAPCVPRTSSLDSSMLARMASRRLLGSFEESLLSGRMSHSKSLSVAGFRAEIGACGAGKTPAHITLPLPAAYYKLPGESSPSPYVGKVQLDADKELLPTGRYRVPSNGLVQVMIYNPEKTGIKVFLVRYDFRDMPRRSRTFLRQRTFVETGGVDAEGFRRRRLLYAIHLRFVCTKTGRIYLYKDIRVVFTHRAPDSSEHINTITEGPSSPVYSPEKSKAASKNVVRQRCDSLEAGSTNDHAVKLFADLGLE